MTATPPIDQLRKDIESARTDLARIEGQQESAQEELAKLEEEAQGLGLDPKKLAAEANRIADDVNAALTGVREEVEAVARRANPGN